MKSLHAVLLLIFLPALSWAQNLSAENVTQLQRMQIQSEWGDFLRVDDQWIDSKYFESGFYQDSKGVLVMGGQPQKVVLWFQGILPLRFQKDVSEALQNMIWAACAEWSRVANVKCVKGPYKNRQLTIGRSYRGVKVGCWSMLGSEEYFAGIKRRMNLGEGCDKYTIVLHELGHAFGLTHEHQRQDRDDYVKIYPENIAKGFLGFDMKLNFGQQPTHNFTPYDFYSIMHYSRYAGSKNGRDTIVPQVPHQDLIDVIGRAQSVSKQDAAALALMYGPSAP